MTFKDSLTEKFKNIDIKSSTEVRWWIAQGYHTDKTIYEQVHAIYDAGFCGIELCQLRDSDIDSSLYGYGSKQWEHDLKLILDLALSLKMTVSLTSGAGWSTTNFPGLDPDSQAANQSLFLAEEILPAGSEYSGALPVYKGIREKSRFIGAYAYKNQKVITDGEYYDLTDNIADGTLTWKAPLDSDYVIRCYYQEGTYQSAQPAVSPSYCINYFDRVGVEALKEYWEKNVLNDAELINKIKNGNVQLFMDSLEYHTGGGIMMWPQDFDKKFYKIKGYDIKPYVFLTIGAPKTSIWSFSDNADLEGVYTLTDKEKATRILNDIYDVMTQLYMSEFMKPFKEWLNSYGIYLRAQISYGKELEISSPIQVVDYPEAENRNQRNQPDIYRLWSGGSKLLNKVLSSETGGLDDSAYAYTYQRQLQEAYALYATGYSRIIWHIWSADYGPTASWPGYESGSGYSGFYKHGTREPSYSDYLQFNTHLSRVQKLLRRGKAGTDVGMLYTKYGQHLVYGTKADWLKEHRTMFFPSTVLQDNGYTYDYFAPSFLTADGVYFDSNTETLELAGYKAVVLWQKVLSLSGAKALLNLAKQGLKVVIVEGAAECSPYDNESKDELFSLVNELKALPNVKTAKNADGVLNALKELGVSAYAEFIKPNRQLLTQMRRDGDNRYLYVYNYCDESQHSPEEARHGKNIKTEIIMDGAYIPYKIDAWTGEVNELGAYKIKNGKTVIPVDLNYGDISLYAFEATEIGERDVNNISIEKGKEYDIKNWTLTVESYTVGDTVSRTETVEGLTTTEYKVNTKKENIKVSLDTLKTWDKITEIGKNISGKGYYSASFDWDGSHSGAYIDFGEVVQSFKVKINGEYTKGVNFNLPKVDISDLLKLGKNTIEIEYSSNLTNVQIYRGIVKDGVIPNNFLGYNTTYLPYGIPKATLFPYSLG